MEDPKSREIQPRAWIRRQLRYLSMKLNVLTNPHSCGWYEPGGGYYPRTRIQRGD